MPEDGVGSESTATPGQSGVQATLFTQEQANHFAAEAKRGALGNFFKEMGFDQVPTAEEVKARFSQASEFEKLQKSQQSDMERLSGELGEVSKRAERVPELEAALLRAQVANDAGLKSRYWKYVEGNSETEIQESVKTLLADIPAGNSEEGERLASRPPAPNPQQGRGGGTPTKTLSAGAEAYRAKHKKE
jgi:hypothetical protein